MLFLIFSHSNLWVSISAGTVTWCGNGQSCSSFVRLNMFSFLSVPPENHRLESSFQNHLVLKVLVVRSNPVLMLLFPNIANFILQRPECGSPLILPVMTPLLPPLLVQLLQLLRLALLHRLRHARHGAAATGGPALHFFLEDDERLSCVFHHCASISSRVWPRC